MMEGRGAKSGIRGVYSSPSALDRKKNVKAAAIVTSHLKEMTSSLTNESAALGYLQ